MTPCCTQATEQASLFGVAIRMRILVRLKEASRLSACRAAHRKSSSTTPRASFSTALTCQICSSLRRNIDAGRVTTRIRSIRVNCQAGHSSGWPTSCAFPRRRCALRWPRAPYNWKSSWSLATSFAEHTVDRLLQDKAAPSNEKARLQRPIRYGSCSRAVKAGESCGRNLLWNTCFPGLPPQWRLRSCSCSVFRFAVVGMVFRCQSSMRESISTGVRARLRGADLRDAIYSGTRRILTSSTTGVPTMKGSSNTRVIRTESRR